MLLFFSQIWTSMTEDFFNFRGEMCTYYVLCNISLWGLGQHPLIIHINISAGEYMNIPTKWGKCEIKTSGQVSSVITLDQIMVATWLSFGFQWFCIADLWGRDCGPADQCKSLPFIDHWFVSLFSHSVVSNSLPPHGLKPARLPCPSLSPRVGSNSWPLSRWCHPTTPLSVIPFSCLHLSQHHGLLVSYAHL